MTSSRVRWYLWMALSVLMASLMDCSRGSPDFIAERCSEFDNIAFDGRYYRWTPYEKGGESCELLCKAEGLSTHQKLRGKVVDGTPCGKQPFSVCVTGNCMRTGCDGQLGSNMTLDNCGVCGGDGTSCSLIDHSGIFNKKTLLSGYNKVVTIPAGSVAVEIKDLGPTLNTLVLVDDSGLKMVLARDVKEAEYIFADTVFLFNTHEQQGQLQAVGPTAHNITVYMYNQGDWNPGISYNYKSVQNDLSINPRKSHHKNQKPSKGQKLQLEIHKQRSANEQNEAESLESKGSNVLTLKDLDLKEEIQNVQQNNLIRTDSFKVDSNSNSDGLEYDSYNHMIDSKGREPVSSTQTGSIWPKNAHGNLAKDQEDGVIQGLPEYFSGVRESLERYMWSFGDWTGCSRKCGQGFQRRVISCIDREQRKIVDPHMCRQRDKPVSMQSCYNRECSVNHPHDTYVRWQPGEWGPCSSSCDLGEQVQEVVCQAVTEEGSTAVVRDDQCYKEYGTKPEYVRSCNEDFPCPKWSFTVWSECSVTCGRGEQKRYVFCQQETAIESGIQKTIADSFCDISLKPVEYRLCSSGPCPKQQYHDRTRPTGFHQSCVHSYYRCCPDGVNPARGPRGEGCPSQENIVISEDDAKNKPKCLDLEFGCCWDQATPASGPNAKGCPPRYSKSQARCNSHPEVGSCRNFTVKWFYNANTTQCDRFWYGGCDGNDNRFSDEKECLDVCKNDKTVETDICDLPAVVGPCRAAHIRWYFEAKEKKCKNFTYGGCGGNDNRFRTEAECERRCSSVVLALGDDREPISTLLCEQSRYGCCQDGVTPATGPNSEGCPKDCQKARYGCCDDGITAAQGEDGKGCEVVAGSGDVDTFCEESVFGCCPDGTTPAQGENNLGCEDVVSPTDSDSGFYIEPATTGACELPKDTGPCRHDLKVMWYYNSVTGLCDRFWYGGCDGNSNRFKSEKECLATCRNADDRDQRGTVLKMPRCEQEQKTGNCRAYIVRWFHNTTSGHCEQFVYGGCEGNDNNFETREACEENCNVVRIGPVEPSRNLPVCEQPKQQGMCLAYIPRWFYNRTSDRCEQFIYGGCQGNDNKFETKEACAARCPSRTSSNVILPVSGPVCEQPNQPGPCYAYIPRWFYNRTSDRCEQFIYGGCQGNDNNFETKEACGRRCPSRASTDPVLPVAGPVCEQPNQPGPCYAYFPRWFYNRTSDRCEQFIYGGCRGNDNNFETKEACAARCPNRTSSNVILPVSGPVEPSRNLPVCEQPKQQGMCLAYFPRWFYNRTSDRCEQFIYGGCQGNDNKFETKEACAARCPSRTSSNVILPVSGGFTPVCQLEPDMGPCRRAETKWHYDVATFSCKTFTYGGCLGNHNNFQTKEKCEEYCNVQPGRSVRETCLSSREPGSCTAQFRRWYYNSETGRCSEFMYGGCQGNGNNFLNEESCMNYCRGIRIEGWTDNRGVTNPPQSAPQPEDICRLPLKTPCNDNTGLQYWYYDYNEGVCREVLEGQCNGNQNNFESKERCEAHCSRENVCRPFTQGVITCAAAIPRWLYNRETNKCEEFIYGGCGGTSNNFASRDACRRKCLAQSEQPADNQAVVNPTTAEEICALSLEVGNALPGQQHWYYDKLTGQCKEFTGSSENRNNFASKEWCEGYCTREVVCQEFVEPEISCYAYIPRWRYNPRIGRCEYFVYGGCGGSINNFGREEDCTRKCVHQKTPVREPSSEVGVSRYNSWHDICKLQADVGPCANYGRKWHYNALTKECEEFTYGGCLGNHNNFESREQCKMYCDQSQVRESQVEVAPGSGSIQGVEVCHLDVDVGTCNSQLHMWHYDYPSGVCKQFDYRGCDGNDNRFDTREECEGICNAAEICRQPVVIGRCRGNFPRYYFDMQTGECREFGYGGCDGNANNFANKEACQRKCGYLAEQKPRPVITKNGSCPSVPSNVIGTCVEACRNDGDCPGDQKCCSNGCGHTCVTSDEAIVKKTVGGNVSDVCHTEERRELCTKYEVKWFFDRSIQRCNRFWYGGCEGRGNKFDTEEECQDICVNRKHGGQVTPIPTPHPSTRTPEPECRGSQYGCCRDGRTPARDRYYSNCPETLADCRLSRFGCCPDGVTAVVDRYYSNCRVNRTDTQTERDDEVTQVLVQPGKRAVMTCYRENYNASIAWYREGLLITPDNNFFIYPNGTLVIQFISSGDAGSYSCRITHGNVLPTIRRFKVTVQEPIRILPTPDTIIVKPGHTAFLHCQAQGSPQPRISWTKGNEPIRSGGRFNVFENGTLLIARTQPEDIDFYVCRAENGISVAVQRTVRLSLKEMLMAKIVNHQNQVTEGGRISLHCSGSGFPTPTVQWEKTGRPITTSGNVYVSDGRLVIRDVTPEDTGVYTCIVANNEEKIESSTTIQVLPKDVQADTCKDIAGEGKCRLIVYAGLCSYKMYSTICCNSCQDNKLA